MKLKELHQLMQDIQPFTHPKVELEQYPTGAELASRLLFTVANSYNEFEGRTVIDLGCGTAMLSIGAAMLGARHVLAVDIDPDALEVAASNIAQFEDDECALPIDLLLCNVIQLGALPPQPASEQAGTAAGQRPVPPAALQAHMVADTVIMNPPFGTKRLHAGADMAFLRAAFRASRSTVYSLHKTSTRAHIQRVAMRDLGAVSAEVLAELRYELPATLKFHKQKSVDIQVDLWRFEVGADQQLR